MKKNIKRIFALSLAALMTGCSGNKAYNNFYQLQARANNVVAAIDAMLIDTRIEAEYASSGVTEIENNLKRTYSESSKLYFDTIDNILHFTVSTHNVCEDKINPTNSYDITDGMEMYIVYESKTGLVVYQKGLGKSIYAPNSAMLAQAQATPTTDFVRRFGEPTFEKIVSYNLWNFAHIFADSALYGSELGWISEADDVIDYAAGAPFTLEKEKYDTQPNSNKFSCEFANKIVTTREDVNIGETYGYEINSWGLKVDGLLVTEATSGYDHEGFHVIDANTEAKSSAHDSSKMTAKKAKNKIVLPDLEKFILE